MAPAARDQHFIGKTPPMRILPTSKVGKVDFCLAKTQAWLHNAADIGVTVPDVEALTALALEARAAIEAAQVAMNAARAAVLAQDIAVAQAAKRASQMILTIKAKAASSPLPEHVLSLALLPVSAQPTAATAPGPATKIKTTLQPTGEIELSWTARNSAAATGGLFRVYRQIAGQRGLTLIGHAPGTSSRKRRMTFVDSTLTSNDARGAAYLLEPVRGGKVGTPGPMVCVQFGRMVEQAPTIATAAVPSRRAA